MYNKCDAYVHVNIGRNGPTCIKNEPISATTASSLAWFRAARRTLKPALASCIANSRPMPSVAPVTTRRFASMTCIELKRGEKGVKHSPAHAPLFAPNFLSCGLNRFQYASG